MLAPTKQRQYAARRNSTPTLTPTLVYRTSPYLRRLASSCSIQRV